MLQSGQSTHSKELAQARIVWFAGLALGILQVLCQPETDNLEHTVERLIRGTDGDEGIGGIEIGPVFEIRRGLKQLRWQRESNGGKVSNANEPIMWWKLVVSTSATFIACPAA